MRSMLVNYNDLTVFPHWNNGTCKGNDPNMVLFQVSELF